jgi:FixJ family two-component response regulator
MFADSGEFLTAHDPDEPGCVVVDLAMPEVDGLELQQRLTAAGINRPIIFVTGRGDIPTTVRAMKAGAIDFLTKPVEAETLLAAVARAKALDAERRRAREEMESARALVARLSPREREVLTHVLAGRLSKQIAADLGTVEKTIKVHRGRIMRKLEVRTIPDLLRLVGRAGIGPSASSR